MRTSLLAVLVSLYLPAQTALETGPHAAIREIAARGYAFAYPLVLMEYTRRAAAAPDNVFRHAPAFPDDRYRVVARPNADTLYSVSWLDLSREPMLLHVPDTAGRYYVMHLLDAWTETFALPGKRTTGTGEAWFAVVGPGWKGTLPPAVRRIDAPTNMVWLLGRTQTNSSSDYPNVHKIQEQYLLMPLSRYGTGSSPSRSDRSARGSSRSATTTPTQQVAALPAVEFFRTFASLLPANPPHAADAPMMRDLARIGVVAGQPFSPPPDIVPALEEGVHQAASAIESAATQEQPHGRTGWTVPRDIGRYRTDYALRAVVARHGLGATPPEEAVYLFCRFDSAGKPFDGASRYNMHFERSELPPVNAFWSVSMYGPDGFFIANPIHRFAIGDRDPLKFNPDGSLDLAIQHNPPEGEQANWLPAPSGPFQLAFRLYWPRESVRSGDWTPPAVRAVQ